VLAGAALAMHHHEAVVEPAQLIAEACPCFMVVSRKCGAKFALTRPVHHLEGSQAARCRALERAAVLALPFTPMRCRASLECSHMDRYCSASHVRCTAKPSSCWPPVATILMRGRTPHARRHTNNGYLYHCLAVGGTLNPATASGEGSCCDK
jgi:hypothetical protein